jgi:hypothetical protein
LLHNFIYSRLLKINNMSFHKTLLITLVMIVYFMINFKICHAQFADTSDHRAQSQILSQDSIRNQDNLKRPVGLFTPQSLGIQFIAGEISYAIPFWSLAYSRLQRDKGQFSNFPDPIILLGLSLACFAVPIGTDLSLNLLHWQQGNIAWGIAGSIFGILVGRLSVQSDAAYTTILYSGVASVITSMLFYDLAKIIWPNQ